MELNSDHGHQEKKGFELEYVRILELMSRQGQTETDR